MVEYVEIDIVGVMSETSMAWKVKLGEPDNPFDKTPSEWLPKSQCDMADDKKSVSVPEWLAIEKGLV